MKEAWEIELAQQIRRAAAPYRYAKWSGLRRYRIGTLHLVCPGHPELGQHAVYCSGGSKNGGGIWAPTLISTGGSLRQLMYACSESTRFVPLFRED